MLVEIGAGTSALPSDTLSLRIVSLRNISAILWKGGVGAAAGILVFVFHKGALKHSDFWLSSVPSGLPWDPSLLWGSLYHLPFQVG